MIQHCSGKRKREEKPPCLREKKERKGDVGASTAVTEELKKIEETVTPYGIPLVPSESNVKARAIFILDYAALRKSFVKKRWKILSSKEDADFLRKQQKNPNDYKPEIVYEALLEIFDSPLNKDGMVGAVYVRIDEGVTFEIKPHVRIPRTCKRFCGIMLELLQKSCIRSKDTHEILMRVIEEPITQHLPVKSRIIGLSYSSVKLVDIEDYVSTCSDDLNLVFVVGAMVRGKISKEITDDFISISNYPLHAKSCAGLICEALEHKWKIF